MKSILAKISGITSVICLATSLTAQINDLTPVANPSTICAGGSSTISVPNSQNGVSYYLQNNSNNSLVAGPIAGNGVNADLNTGTLNTTTTFNVVGTASNMALDFDGVDDYVLTNFAFPSVPFLTIEAWVYPRATTANRFISSYSGGGSFANGEILLDNVSSANNGRGLRFIVPNAGTPQILSVDNVLTLNAWNHIAATFNNGVMTIYVDGVQVGTMTAPFTTITSNSSRFVALGEDRAIGASEYFDGKMDEVRIWFVARTASEILNDKNTCMSGAETGMIALYKLDAQESSIAFEEIAAKNGVLNNMSPATDWAWGAPLTCSSPTNYALDFDGTNDRVTTGFHFSSPVDELSLETWIYPRGTNLNRFISNMFSTTLSAGEFTLDNSSTLNNGRGLTFSISNGGTGSVSVDNVLTLNAWNHVAVTFDNTGALKLYVNGILVGSSNAGFSGVFANTSVNLTLGEDAIVGTFQFFNGKMDDVRVWTIARTAADINANMNRSLQGNEFGLAAYYPLDNFGRNIVSERVAGKNGNLAGMNMATAWVSGAPIIANKIVERLNAALNFNGNNQRVATTRTIPATSTLTLEAWVNPSATTAKRFVSTYSGGGPFVNGELLLDNVSSTMNGQGLRFIVSTTGNTIHTLSVNNVLTLNTWNHIAATFDNGVVKLYVDGVEVGTNNAPFSSIAANSSNISLGEDYNIGSAEFYLGKMDEFRVWTTARTASEIQNFRNTCLTGTEPGLNLYFNFNEGIGISLYDLVTGTSPGTGTLVNISTSSWSLSDGLMCSLNSALQQTMSQTVTITVNQAVTSTQTLNECAGFSITIGSNTYTSSGTYIDTLVAASSCDSIVTTNLTVAAAIDVDVTLSGTILTADQTGATYQWLDCNNGNAPIAGATNQSFEPTANGDYAVEITVGSCTETTSCFNVTGVGIDQIANPITWSVFPNPTSNKLNIKTSEWTNIAIVNVLGQEMHTQQVQGTATIDISNFENGVYFVRNLNNNSVVKIVKN